MISIDLARKISLGPRQERNLAHLGQIHPHRIIDPLRCHHPLEHRGRRLGRALVLGHGRAGGAGNDGSAAVRVRVVDDLDALVFERHEELIHSLRWNESILEDRVDLSVAQKALAVAFFEQHLDGLFDLVGHGSAGVLEVGEPGC